MAIGGGGEGGEEGRGGEGEVKQKEEKEGRREYGKGDARVHLGAGGGLCPPPRLNLAPLDFNF